MRIEGKVLDPRHHEAPPWMSVPAPMESDRDTFISTLPVGRSKVQLKAPRRPGSTAMQHPEVLRSHVRRMDRPRPVSRRPSWNPGDTKARLAHSRSKYEADTGHDTWPRPEPRRTLCYRTGYRGTTPLPPEPLSHTRSWVRSRPPVPPQSLRPFLPVLLTPSAQSSCLNYCNSLYCIWPARRGQTDLPNSLSALVTPLL